MSKAFFRWAVFFIFSFLFDSDLELTKQGNYLIHRRLKADADVSGIKEALEGLSEITLQDCIESITGRLLYGHIELTIYWENTVKDCCAEIVGLLEGLQEYIAEEINAIDASNAESIIQEVKRQLEEIKVKTKDKISSFRENIIRRETAKSGNLKPLLKAEKEIIDWIDNLSSTFDEWLR